MLKLLLLPFRLALGVLSVSTRVGYRTGRLVGFGRMATFTAGVGVGVLLASPRAREAARAGVATAAAAIRDARRPGDDDLAEAVRAELHTSTTTWHLAQPDVEVVDGQVVLHGEAPDEVGRQSLAEVAAAVPGVRSVDNRIALTTDDRQ